MAGARGRRWKCKSRPCVVCRRWFTPDPRVGDRQKTCGRAECQREHHRRNERESRRTHAVAEHEATLRARLQGFGEAGHALRGGPLAPLDLCVVAEVLGTDGVIVLEELGEGLRTPTLLKPRR